MIDDIELIEYGKVQKYIDGGGKPVDGQCYQCDQNKKVTWTDNPFTSEIYSITRMEWICEKCYGELCDDV